MSASEADVERQNCAQWNAEIARGNAHSHAHSRNLKHHSLVANPSVALQLDPQLLGLRGGAVSEADIERLGRGMADFDRAQKEPPTPVSLSEANLNPKP